MIDYEKEFGAPGYSTKQTALAATYKVVYGWMAAGLALSGVVAWYTAASGLWARILSGPGMAVCILAELALVFVISGMVNKLSAGVATALFALYAAVNGLTLSVVFVAYELAVVQKIFFITAAMFGGLAAWGSFTKSDLSSIGSFCGMALWGIIVACVANFFFKSAQLDWAISFLSVIVFSGLAMYDAQKIKALAEAERGMDAQAVAKAGILGALALYLDFVNIFLSLLRMFGKER